MRKPSPKSSSARFKRARRNGKAGNRSTPVTGFCYYRMSSLDQSFIAWSTDHARCRLGWRVHRPMRARLLRRGRRSRLRPCGAQYSQKPSAPAPAATMAASSPATTGFVCRLGRPASGTVMPRSSKPVLNDACEAVGLSTESSVAASAFAWSLGTSNWVKSYVSI